MGKDRNPPEGGVYRSFVKHSTKFSGATNYHGVAGHVSNSVDGDRVPFCYLQWPEKLS